MIKKVKLTTCEIEIRTSLKTFRNLDKICREKTGKKLPDNPQEIVEKIIEFEGLGNELLKELTGFEEDYESELDPGDFLGCFLPLQIASLPLSMRDTYEKAIEPQNLMKTTAQ